MKCIIPNQNVKIIARAIHSLSKIGDEMYVEPMREEITFRTVNMAQSAFAEFKMNQSFFSSYTFSDPEDCDSLCKVMMRSCVNVFKNVHNLDKQVENCEIRLKPDATVIIFQIKFTNAPVKKYYLPVIESEKLEANIPSDALNRISASSKMLMSTIKNFRYSEDEITFRVDKDKAYIKNHIELKKDLHTMRTELCFHPSEFENYSVTNPASITFCFKELRAVLSFAEPSNLSVCMSFSSAGMPILFQVPHSPVYVASYVVSTLNVNPTYLITSTNPQRSIINHPQSSTNLDVIVEQHQRNPYSFIEESEDVQVGQNSVIEETMSNSANVSAMNMVGRSFRIDCNEEQVNTSTSETTNAQISRKRKNCDLNSDLTLSESIESIYSSLETNTCNGQSNIPNISSKNSLKVPENKESVLELIRIVFARCLKTKNIPGQINNAMVIADNSDIESV